MAAGNTLEEWKSLRDEIARKQASCERIATGTVAANLAVYSFAMHDPTSINVYPILMLPPLLASVAHYWILSHFHSVRRVAEYIQSTLEPKLGIEWERTVAQKRRLRGQSKQLSPYAFVSWSFYVISVVASFWCIYVTAALREECAWALTGITVVLMHAALGVLSWLFFRKKENEIASLE